jgi:alpha-beta hydrolase superfamily lysophospholipase
MATTLSPRLFTLKPPGQTLPGRGFPGHSVVARSHCAPTTRDVSLSPMNTDAHTLARTDTPLTSPCPRYADSDAWRSYQPFFPEAMRCSEATTPTEEWWGWNGLDVHLDRSAVPTSPLKVIVLHGAGAYGRVMAPAAVLARKHGYETVAPDLPGYGLTKVDPARLDYNLWIDCVSALIDAELARDGRPVVLFGVSLGGLLAYHAAARSRRVVGLVATTLADPRETAVRQGFARTALLGSAGLWLLHQLRGVTDGLPLPMRHMSKMNRISNNPELSALCSGDPLGGGSWVPARFLRTLMYTAPDLEPEAFDVCPVLLTHPGVDRMTDISLSRRFFDRLKAPKRMVVLEGASHMPTEHPGVDQLESAVVEFVDAIARTARA